MTQPDWCPQEVLEEAHILLRLVELNARRDAHLSLAKALLEVEQRGRRKGLEEAAKLCAENTEIIAGRNRRWLEPHDPEMGSTHTGMTYAAAIRTKLDEVQK